MKKTVLFLLLTILLSSTGHGQKSITPFSSRMGSFTAQIPGLAPNESRSKDGYSNNGIVTSIDGKTTYAVEFKCLCDKFDQPEQATQQMDLTISEVQTRMGLKVVSESSVAIGDESGGASRFPGKEVKLESSSNVAIFRVYLTDDKSYLLSVVTEKPDQIPADAAAFFSSFRLGIPIKDSSGNSIGPVPGGIPGGVPSSGSTGRVEPPKDSTTTAGIAPAGNGPPKQVRRSEGVIRGNAISLVVPRYPTLAVKGRIHGKVMIDVLIDEDGYVVSAVPRCGHPMLAAAALQAARDSIFKPTTLAGVPVKVQGFLTYNFAF